MANTKWNDPEFEKRLLHAAAENFSCRSTLDSLGILTSSSSKQTYASKKLKELGADLSHWTGQGHLRGKTHSWTSQIPLEEILVEGSTYSRNHLKARLIKEDYLDDSMCSICATSQWMGTKVPLHLDHVNGVNNDNRLSNLRLICPNCHAQTDTYCGRNVKLRRDKQSAKV